MTIAIDVDQPWLRRAKHGQFTDDVISPGELFAVSDEPGLRSYGVWLYDGEAISRVDLPHQGATLKVPVADGSRVMEGLRKATAGVVGHCTARKLELRLGTYYPGMARPEGFHFGQAASRAPDFDRRESELTASLLQLRSLFRALEDIFQVVHPDATNLATFGSAIRDLLILASTECEAQWAAVLRLNSYPNKRPTRRDYRKLGKAMRLSEFTIMLRHYRSFEALTPFTGWDGKQAEAPLPWYDAYNAVKHDRAGAFKRATLEAALNAVAACWVMIAAQYGYSALRVFPDLNDRFRVWYAPNFPLAECYHSGPHGYSVEEAEVPYPF